MNTVTLDFLFAIFWVGLIALSIIWFYKSYKDTSPEEINHYELGLKNIIEGKARVAIEHLKEAIRSDSSNIDAYVKLGNILRAEGAVSQALRVHKDLTLRADLSQDDRILIVKAIADDLIMLKREDQAQKFLEQLLASNPNEDAIFDLLKIYENKQLFAEAFKIIKLSKNEKIKDKTVRLAYYKVMLGLAKTEIGAEKEARLIYKEAIKINPKCEAAYILIGDSYLREDRKEDAINKWLECSQIIPEKSHFLFERLEKVWFDTGEFYKIEEFYLQQYQKRNSFTKALIALCEIKLKKGEIKQALGLCEEYLRNNPSDKYVRAYYISYELRDPNNRLVLGEMQQFLKSHYLTFLNDYNCAVCGKVEDEPLAKCNSCGSWGSFV
jgi:lipopolysaccharide biosynthesis regulator YciM